MTTVQLECTATDCKAGPGGAKWKTSALPPDTALQLLVLHRQDQHGVAVPTVVNDGEGGARGKLVKLDRPKLAENCSQQDFEFFRTEWNAYYESTGKQSDKIMKDQLLQCADESLRKTIRMSLGNRAESISLVDLMEEVKTAAVEMQSDMLNEVRLMEAKQERDEPVRKFLARLKGLAGICQLKVKCACDENPSYADRIIHTTLVKGLVDNETKGEILSKVDKLTLEQTIAFVEARETGQRSLAGLGGSGLAGQQIHTVRDYSESQCWRCGETGHTSRFKDCKAKRATCGRCKKIGHFTKFCRTKETSTKDQNPEEHIKTDALMMHGLKMSSSMLKKRGVVNESANITQI